MRLTEAERAAIVAITHELFGADATVRLFGSRVRDDARGGDVDLHVETPCAATLDASLRYRARLAAALDDREIDVVFRVRDGDARPIDERAHADGIVL